ncbi:hypothetical protein MKS88_003966 [Plasmodium brasilianum]|uniref:Uncharacterized protein n=1 Tax=Plasmodium brasilianum TaxID=5824 RepID=A0ACB9Y8N4_PLABR|nr:hypothetical protein MKS88_003966 [Plasmodium brasilianum]
MLIFFTKDFIFTCLIWAFKYSDESPNYYKSLNKEMNRNNILNVKFNRLLCSETRSSVEDKYKFSKEKKMI